MSRSLLIASMLVACGPAVPENPTYFADVQPILRANCSRCHGADPIDLKVAKYRLDRYVANDTATIDAFDYAQSIAEHTAAHVEPVMPPDYELSDRQHEILARWALAPDKGTRSNTLGRIELIAPQGTTTADETIDTTFRAWDEDLDGLAIQLWARDESDPTQPIPLGNPTGGGERSISIDSGTLASKHTFVIYAVVDDGFDDDPAVNEMNKVPLLESVYVDHGARGTAPTVKLTAPNVGGTQIGTIAIAWSATDPDVDTSGNPDVLSIDLALVGFDASGNEISTRTITTGLPNAPSSFTWTIPADVVTSNANGPIPYKVRVTAHDTLPTLANLPPNERSDDSDLPFTIEKSTTTTYTWTDSPSPGGVGALFTKYCKECHGQPAKSPQLEPYCYLEYDQAHNVAPCAPSDLGVYEQRADIYNRVVTLANMPPASAMVKMSAADRSVIGNWLAGGAPYGSGPSDAKPTFTWNTPSSNATLPATVSWTASDNSLETGTIDMLEYTGSCNMPNCCANAMGASTVVPITDPKAMFSTSGATTWTDSLSLTKPSGSTGKFYCVRGTVTDTAGQTTTAVNPAGLK